MSTQNASSEIVNMGYDVVVLYDAIIFYTLAVFWFEESYMIIHWKYVH
jgi:hypothetical protein